MVEEEMIQNAGINTPLQAPEKSQSHHTKDLIGEHQEHFPDGPFNGKGKVDNGLKAKNQIFVRAKILRDKKDQSDIDTDDLTLPGKIFKTTSGQKLIKSVIYECIRVSINFPEANKVKGL